MIKRIRAFHKKTVEQYLKDHKEQLEPWKIHVMELHERSGFLFYYDTSEIEKAEEGELVVQGDIAKAEVPENRRLYLYDGQGRLLGEGALMSDPFEKEEKRRGFLRSRKHEFVLKIIKLQEKELSGLGQKEKKRLLQFFFREASLLSDILL